MIKKMMALLAAISCAIGAWADVSGHLSGTDFSGLSAGPFVTGLDDSGQSSGTTYWFAGDPADIEGSTIVSNSPSEVYLDFESNIANPLYRTIDNCHGAGSVSALPKRSIGTGLFIDTHVQFTPYLVNDQHLAPSAITDDDKLIVWVRETEVENDANETNLIVTAGYYDAYNNLSASNYVVNISSADVSELCSHTNRLTIKSYSNITDSEGGPAGFVVYLNEHAIEYTADAFATGCDYLDDLAATPGSYYETGHHMLFPSLMGCNLTDYDKLSGVGYAGMGQIYDVIFDDKSTDFPPFAADATDFKVVPGEGVASFIYDNVPYTTEQSFTVPAAVASVTISNVVYSSGWQHKKGTWYNGSTIVSNEYDAVTDTDYGTFVLANGTTLNLAGFKPNFTVGGVQYQTLFGGTVTEPTGAFGAAKNGGTIVLNNDILIAEGEGQIVVGENDELTIDLNGHTIQGTTADGTIVNEGGTLTIVDNSVGQTGKVLGCWVENPDYPADSDEPMFNNQQALSITEEAVATTLDAGTYEFITKDELNNSLVISNGAYLCVNEDEPGEQPTSFYLVGSLADGATYIWSQDPDTDLWYAIVTSGSAPTTYPVTFSTNSVVVAEYTTNITAGATLPDGAIPAFTGGAWDIDPTGAVISAATNFNYTIAVQLSYFPQSTIEEQWADRDGSAAKPFVVRNLADLYGLQDDISKGYNIDACFEQVADIDMDGEAAWSGIGAFEVTSAGAGAFEGTYDGGNHVISNVTFDQHEYHGLFASAVGAVIKNLTVDVDGFAATSSFGGAAIAGVAENCYLTNLVATGTIIGQSNTPCTHSAAGIAVRMEGTVAYACTNRCEIWSGKGKLGGIAAIGQPYNSVTGRDYLTLCSNEGDIHNTKASLSDVEGVGGLFGYLGYNSNNVGKQHITFTDCRSIGTVDSAASNNTGSFVGNTSDLNVEAIVLSGTNVTLDGMRVIYTENAPGGVTYGKSIGNGLVELCAQAAFETNNTYSTLHSGLTPTFEFSAPGTISFNTNLYAVTAFAITATGIDVTESESGGIVTFTAGSSDPWAPASESAADVAAKVEEIFGAESEVAANVTTYAQYEALVTYIQSTAGAPATPDLLTEGQVDWMWKSYILGANPLFDEEPAVQITSLTAGATAGLWDFTVKVTEGDDTDAYNVAADKVGALVKISSSLTPGTWVAPTAGNIEAVKLLGGNLIKVTVNFGDGTSGFMKVSEE